MSTQLKNSDKRELILSSALKQFVEFGFHGTPTSKIASDAGMAHGTLFHYFKTKDELVAALYSHIKEGFRSYLTKKITTSTDIKERFLSLFYYSVEWSLRNRDEFYFTQQFQYSPHLKQSGAEELAKESSLHRQLYLEAIETNTFKNTPVDLVSLLCIGQMIGVYNYLVNQELSVSAQKKLIEQTAVSTWEMFLK